MAGDLDFTVEFNPKTLWPFAAQLRSGWIVPGVTIVDGDSIHLTSETNTLITGSLRPISIDAKH